MGKTIAMTLTPSGEIIDNYEWELMPFHHLICFDDVEYFKNKMLQGFAIPKGLHSCS
jgi:hypothetical protein